ncbi:MAG: asparagine synthase (glutamine-hydrolyzing) [Massiliimalia sp.]|jgi:asparagine synthase (glutamine-hydrolysing)
MCGYVGFADHIADKETVLKNMMNTIIHRGPDSEGMYTDGDIALGFRRLSIIDLEAGDQPLFNEDNSIVLVFNGEIYNYQELREDLIQKGHRFRTHSDSETLIHLYEEYDEKTMLNKLRGMFSFSIWDQNEQKLFCAHDYFGIKPLYYAQMNGSFLFGSEIKAFLEHPSFEKKLNPEILEQYLTFQYSPCQETFFQGVFKLPPAHYLTYQNGKVQVERYWEIKFQPDNSKTLDQWVEEIKNVMQDSVKMHKVSDVEVGSFLSSGVDSSYVACLADVDKTFTVGFAPEQYNEISYAKEFSEYIHVKNISKVISPKEYWDNLSNIQYHMDEPLADPAAIALYFVSKEASKHVKVALSGEGADEIFGGYNVYREPLEFTAYNKIPMPIRRAIGAVARKFPKVRGFNFLVRRSMTLEERFIGNAFMFDEGEKNHLLKHRVAKLKPTDITKPFYDKTKGQDPVTRMQYLDLHMWMAYDILLKADKMSMANSLEVRVPFLDKRVMEVASHIPAQYRVQGPVTKMAMRKAANEVIPAKTADKKKLGFPVPIRVWLKEDKYYGIVKKYFTSKTAEEFFNTQYLVKLLDQHREGKYDNSRKIWTVFMFLKWYEEFFIKR